MVVGPGFPSVQNVSSTPIKMYQINYDAADALGTYSRFFEQAFEWEQMG
jgi:hypothetical protein